MVDELLSVTHISMKHHRIHLFQRSYLPVLAHQLALTLEHRTKQLPKDEDKV